MKRNGLWFVCVTKKNISPAYGMELLNRICQVGAVSSGTAFLTLRRPCRHQTLKPTPPRMAADPVAVGIPGD